MRVIAMASLLCIAASASAAPAPILARASLLQAPVWVERDGARSALHPGAALYPGDRYQTGTGGRLHIEMEDASTVKLGENARFELPALALVDDGSDTGLFKGALKVLKGAFRFTTSALGALRKRELDVYVGPTITAGIRGTDIWGKSEDSQELLCLLEGRIEVSSPGQPAQVMDQARTFYVVPRDQPPLPIVPTPGDKLAQWVPQTEMVPEAPAQSASGRFGVVLGSFPAEAAAQAEAQRLSALGYAADLRPAPRAGKTWQRVVIGGFDTRAAATRFVAIAKQRLGAAQPWVIAPR